METTLDQIKRYSGGKDIAVLAPLNHDINDISVFLHGVPLPDSISRQPYTKDPDLMPILHEINAANEGVFKRINIEGIRRKLLYLKFLQSGGASIHLYLIEPAKGFGPELDE